LAFKGDLAFNVKLALKNKALFNKASPKDNKDPVKKNRKSNKTDIG
jgi:hypothetical protein